MLSTQEVQPSTPILDHHPLSQHDLEERDRLAQYRQCDQPKLLFDQPSDSERAAQTKLDHLNLGEKAALSPEQSDTLRRMETAILHGDLQGTEAILHKFKDDPDAAKPIMDVLVKDLEEAGIKASYDVNYPINAAGVAQRSGMFSLQTEKDGMDFLTGDNKSMCLYTNPGASTWAEHQVPVQRNDGIVSNPDSHKIPPDLALKEIGARAASNLLEQK